VPVVGAGGGAAIADEATSAAMMEGFQKRSVRVRVEGFVPARYDTLTKRHRESSFGNHDCVSSIGGLIETAIDKRYSNRAENPCKIFSGLTHLGFFTRMDDEAVPALCSITECLADRFT
jgi:hypothetical protein